MAHFKLTEAEKKALLFVGTHYAANQLPLPEILAEPAMADQVIIGLGELSGRCIWGTAWLRSSAFRVTRLARKELLDELKASIDQRIRELKMRNLAPGFEVLPSLWAARGR